MRAAFNNITEPEKERIGTTNNLSGYQDFLAIVGTGEDDHSRLAELGRYEGTSPRMAFLEIRQPCEESHRASAPLPSPHPMGTGREVTFQPSHVLAVAPDSGGFALHLELTPH